MSLLYGLLVAICESLRFDTDCFHCLLSVYPVTELGFLAPGASNHNGRPKRSYINFEKSQLFYFIVAPCILKIL
jgi:hypothetical protein